MSPTFSQLRTTGGYVVGEVASAMQKEIRRGNEYEALFWATELELQGLGGYVWKRLRIIASEDVGLADPLVAVQVRTLYENWRDEVRKTRPEYMGFVRVFLVHAVCLLCRAQKSRMLDHALMVMYAGERPKLRVPDYALDQHTKRGRMKKRGMEHFLAEGSKLANQSDTFDPYVEQGHANVLGDEQRGAFSTTGEHDTEEQLEI